MTVRSLSSDVEHDVLPQDCKIATVEAYVQRVSRKVEFLFVRLVTSSGAEGWGEGTFNALNGQIAVALKVLSQGLNGKALGDVRPFLAKQPCWKHGRAFRVAVNALEQAAFDTEARLRNVPVHVLLGQQRHSKVRCYANINRGTSDRSPTGWASRAASALEAGHTAVKLAPFDGVGDGSCAERLHEAGPGLDSFFAVRDAIGSDIDLMLDCHWRFGEESTREIVERVSPAKPAWIEAPMLEGNETIPVLRRVREFANQNGIKLAGGEFHVGVRGWAPFLRQRVYDIGNPDVRFCGLSGMVEIAAQAADCRIGFAPHNHLGPVMTAASLQAMAVAPTAQVLELQYAESEVAPCLKDLSPLALKDGSLSVPEGAGLGIEIDTRALSAVRLY